MFYFSMCDPSAMNIPVYVVWEGTSFGPFYVEESKFEIEMNLGFFFAFLLFRWFECNLQHFLLAI